MVLIAPLRVLALAGLALIAVAAGPLDAQETPRQRLAFGFMLDSGPPLTVKEVIPGSPVARAGIQKGDVLISVDGRPATIQSIREAGRRAAPGQEVRFRIRRNGREEIVGVVPETRGRTAVAPRPRDRGPIVIIDPDSVKALVELYLDGAREGLELHGLDLDFDFDFELDDSTITLRHFNWDSLGKTLEGLGPAMEKMTRGLEGRSIEIPDISVMVEAYGVLPGARLSTLEPGLARYFPGVERGMLVLSVRPGSRSAQAGIEAGDVIVEIDGDPVTSLGDLRRALGRAGESHEIGLIRHGERRTVTLHR